MSGTEMAYLKGETMPLADAKISVMTHAFHYGTAVFEGIRANWNAEHEQLYLFRMREHYERLRKSARALMMDLPLSDDELCDITVDLVQRSDFHQDVYIRPMVYKSAEALGVRLHGVQDDFLCFLIPWGAYLDTTGGVHVVTSSWRRTEDQSIPVRAKVTGAYINSALAKSEAEMAGFDEAILLNEDGHVSEGSGENIFIINDGVIYTPPSSDNILVGITRNTVMELAKTELGIPTVERTLDRSELWLADEVFMTGTAAHVTPISSVDRRTIGNGETGPITAQLERLYFDAIIGNRDAYSHWLTPVYTNSNTSD